MATAIYDILTQLWRAAVRTNIELDDELIAEAMKSSGAKTKRAVVEQGLRLIVRLRRQESVRDLWGTVKWEGDLERSRLDRAEE